MGTYTYKDSKVIDEVTFVRTPNGAVRAYLHAAPEADVDTIKKVLDALKTSDMDCIPYTFKGKPSIEVRGFKRETKLMVLLNQNEFVTPKPEVTPDKEDASSWLEKIKKRSLQASGFLYAGGDISFFAYGMKDKSPLDMAAGILYFLPTPVLIAYGRNDQSQLQIKDFARDMAKEFKKEVDRLPDDCSLQQLTSERKKGAMETVSDVFQRYPSEFMNLCYAGAGACILVAAVKHLGKLKSAGIETKVFEDWMKGMQKTNPTVTKEAVTALAEKSVRNEQYFNAAVGTTTVASGLFGAFVKEKAHDPDAPAKAGIAGIWEWARERPLTIAAAGFMASTLLHAASTAVAVKGHDTAHKGAVNFRIAFVVSALLAELMVAISSKGHGEGVVSDRSVDDSAIAMAADLIVKQPKGLQNHLIEQMGAYLGRPDMLAIKDIDAVALLRRQVEALRENPWVKAEGLHQPTPEEVQAEEAAAAQKQQLVLQSPMSVATREIAKQQMALWQGKLAASDAAKPQFQTPA